MDLGALGLGSGAGRRDVDIGGAWDDSWLFMI